MDNDTEVALDRPLPTLGDPATDLRTFTTIDDVRGDLVDVYADVRSELLHLPNYAVTAFGERLDRHGVEPGFVAVLAYADGFPVGYAYANTIEHGDRYWERTSPPPADKYTDAPAAALKEIGVRTPGPSQLVALARPSRGCRRSEHL